MSARQHPAAVRGVLAALIVLCAVFGVVELIVQHRADGDRARYAALTECRPRAVSDSCWEAIPATVGGRSDAHSLLGSRRDVLGLITPSGQLAVQVEPLNAYRCLGIGDPVTLKAWRGTITGVLAAPGFIPTPANPNVAANDHLEAGTFLLAVSVIVPVGVALARRMARRHPPRPVAEQLRSRGLQFAAIVFGAGQLADVVTSAAGQRAGLLEGNALVADFIDQVGPFGFLLFRLPILVLALMAIFRLPRRAAMGVMLGCGVYFGYVGVHNMHLVLEATGVPATCSGGPTL